MPHLVVSRMPFLVRPFAALRPRAERAGDVIAPPYDVVSTDEARALVRDRPSSFLHVSRPEIDLPAGTSPYADAVYARGAAEFRGAARDGARARTASRRTTSIA